MAERDEAQSTADGDPTVVDAVAVPGGATPGAAVTGLGVPVVDDDTAGGDDGATRGGCRTDRRGWAGAHLHGAVRPRRRAAGRGRPPGRWC